MLVHGVSYRTISIADDGWSVAVIDQTRLPFAFELLHLQTAEQAASAIRDMVGMAPEEINVHIQDVAYPELESEHNQP
jgi:methylthioribose-1-phosphate isomerase